MPLPDDFYSTRDAAGELGVSIKTVQMWVESGVLQAWKTPGGHRRITRDSVRSMLEQRIQKTTTPTTTPVDKATPRFNLLVVEDEAHLRKLYELTITHWGLPMTLSTVSNGFEGLIRIGQTKPDVLITDLQMPGMDGFRLIETLRNNPAYRSIRIIVVSGLPAADIQSRGLIGSDIPLFSKPIPFASLRSTIERYLVDA
ncbi:MAG: response regulator [Steroidobacteraceae bacterium]